MPLLQLACCTNTYVRSSVSEGEANGALAQGSEGNLDKSTNKELEECHEAIILFLLRTKRQLEKENM